MSFLLGIRKLFVNLELNSTVVWYVNAKILQLFTQHLFTEEENGKTEAYIMLADGKTNFYGKQPTLHYKLEIFDKCLCNEHSLVCLVNSILCLSYFKVWFIWKTEYTRVWHFQECVQSSANNIKLVNTKVNFLFGINFSSEYFWVSFIMENFIICEFWFLRSAQQNSFLIQPDKCIRTQNAHQRDH